MRIPLFPLNLVLFPGQTLPLHIFEERYKAMLQKCISDRIPFGLVLIRENSRMGRGTPNSIGTFAIVTKVDEIPEGSCLVPAPHRGNCYHIICKGDERFRITALDRREAEYLVGDVDTFPDEPSPAPSLAMVAARVTDMFDEYYRSVIALMGGWQRQAERGQPTMMFDMTTLIGGQTRPSGDGPRTITVPMLPADPRALSHVVATELNVQPDVKQELLECPSALARLQREAEILAEETPQLHERLTMQVRRRFSSFGMSS
jgi:Lon protease-like protein